MVGKEGGGIDIGELKREENDDKNLVKVNLGRCFGRVNQQEMYIASSRQYPCVFFLLIFRKMSTHPLLQKNVFSSSPVHLFYPTILTPKYEEFNIEFEDADGDDGVDSDCRTTWNRRVRSEGVVNRFDCRNR